MANGYLKSCMVNRPFSNNNGDVAGRRNLGEILHVIAENGFLNEHGVELFQLLATIFAMGLCTQP